MRLIVALALGALASCGDDDVRNYAALERHVKNNRVGQAPDYWIEMRGFLGDWQKVGLIFQYEDDYQECRKAMSGLKKVNYARDYRCTRAN